MNHLKKTEIGKIPESWQVKGIMNCCSEVFLGLTAKVDYVESGGIPLIRAKDINNGYLSFAEARSISEEQHRELTKYRQAKRGDILITKSGTLGICAIVDTDRDFSIYESIIVLQPKVEEVFSPFLLWLMRCETTQKKLLGERVGSTVGHLNLTDFRHLKVPLPPLPEQKKIAAILNSVDEAIAKTQAVIDQTRKVKQGLLQQLLTRGIGHTKFKDSAIGKIPKSWEVVRLREIAASQSSSFVNGPFGSNLLTSELCSSGVPVIYIKDIKNSFYEPKEIVYVSEEKANELSACEVKPGDVLITKVGEPPTTASIYPNYLSRAIITQDVIRLRVDSNKSTPEFVRIFINSPLGRYLVEEIAIEGTRKRVALGSFKNIWFPLPPLVEQKKIVEIINQLELEIITALQSINSYQVLKRGLMQDLLTGRVRVKGA